MLIGGYRGVDWGGGGGYGPCVPWTPPTWKRKRKCHMALYMAQSYYVPLSGYQYGPGLYGHL